jgi:hypothetical protein
MMHPIDGSDFFFVSVSGSVASWTPTYSVAGYHPTYMMGEPGVTMWKCHYCGQLRLTSNLVCSGCGAHYSVRSEIKLVTGGKL